MHGYAGGVDLCEGEVRQECAFLECLYGGRAVAAHGVGRQEECASVAAGGKYYGVCGVALNLAGDEVAHYDAAGTAVDDDDVEHFATVERVHRAFVDLAVERAVGAEQELLSCLSFGVECTAHLCAAERAVGEQAAIFTCEGHALGYALVDDVARHFGEAVHVGFARTEVAALDRVVEQTVNRVAVVLVVLGCVDAALGRNGVCAARAVLNAEVVYVEAHFAEGRGCRCPCEAGAHHDDVEVALVGGVHQVLVGFVVGPFLSDGTFRYLGVDGVLRQFARLDVGVVLHDGAGINHALKVGFLCHISELDYSLLSFWVCLSCLARSTLPFMNCSNWPSCWRAGRDTAGACLAAYSLMAVACSA